MPRGCRVIDTRWRSIRLSNSSGKAYFEPAVDVQAGPLMRTARGALQIALLLSLLGEGALGSCHSFGATSGGRRGWATALDRQVHNQVNKLGSRFVCMCGPLSRGRFLLGFLG